MNETPSIEPAARALELIERLGRVAAAESWGAGLMNPTQRAALSYLARANRFSRRPSAVADYLAATKGTVSQTLLALERKGLTTRIASETDGRSARYDLTPAGRAALDGRAEMVEALISLGAAEGRRLVDLLERALLAALAARGDRAFGVCRTCRHFLNEAGGGPRCGLLEVALAAGEPDKICFEHAPPPAAMRERGADQEDVG